MKKKIKDNIFWQSPFITSIYANKLENDAILESNV